MGEGFAKQDGIVMVEAEHGFSVAVVRRCGRTGVMTYRGIRLLSVLTFLTPREVEDRALDDIARGMAAGTLSHHVGPRFGWEEVAAAHEAVEAGVWGKVVLELG